MNPRNEFQTKISGEVWTVRFLPRSKLPKDTWGRCDRHRKVIEVQLNLCDKTTLDVLIHECLHASNPILFESEEFVTDLATEIAAVLAKCGFRRIA